MNIRQLLSVSVLYGLADVLVVAIGGFLLLPLYTRTLTQAEFGTYFIVRANTDILLYLLYLGLPSAITRLYFDYRPSGRHSEYLASILTLFFVYSAVVAVALFLWGDVGWRLLSPSTPAQPYIWYSFAIAFVGFLSTVGALVMRLEENARRFVSVQIAAAIVLVVASFVTLSVWHLGLPGLLMSLVLGAFPPALTLFVMMRANLRPRLHPAQLIQSLKYGAPFVVTYLSFFFLNRFSTVVLQRHVSLDEIALFGLAQQLSTIVTVGSGAFGKALQPAVFGAKAEDARIVLQRSAKLFIVLMLPATAALMLFANELVAVVAPHKYGVSIVLLVVLVAGNFAQALCLISSMTLEYFKKPGYSAGVTITSAVLSAALNLWLIPRYAIFGAAAALAIGYLIPALLGHLLAYRVSGVSFFSLVLPSLLAVGAVAVLAFLVDRQALVWWESFGVRIVVFVAVGAATVGLLAPREYLKSWRSYVPFLRAL